MPACATSRPSALRPTETELCSYASILYVEIDQTVTRAETDRDGNVSWVEDEEATPAKEEGATVPKMHIGRIPIMLRSHFCVLPNLDVPVSELNECEYDNVRAPRQAALMARAATSSSTDRKRSSLPRNASPAITSTCSPRRRRQR